jgi:DNA-binding MarR family transcriptional regulator
MADTVPTAEIEQWLDTLGMECLCQWDVLSFLFSHKCSLAGAEYLARLIGYDTDSVVAALATLESLGLVERSRVSQGARLYRFTAPTDPRRREAFERLIALAGTRAGRLAVYQRLQNHNRPGQDSQGTPRLYKLHEPSLPQHEREAENRTGLQPVQTQYFAPAAEVQQGAAMQETAICRKQAI